MTCTEFRDVASESMNTGRSTEQEKHLQTCVECAGMVADLDAILQVSRTLRDSEEPSPRVWNSLEIALRKEGLVRGPQGVPFLVQPQARRFHWAWLATAAAMMVLLIGLASYQRNHRTETEQVAISHPLADIKTQAVTLAALDQVDDEELLTVFTPAPATRDAYKAELQNVNAYIRDAEESMKSNPDDDASQQYLMAAYEQKAMVYQMAMDHNLP